VLPCALKIINFVVLAKINRYKNFVARKKLAMNHSVEIKVRQAIFFLTLVLLFSSHTLFSQKAPANESQLKKQANNYFEDEDYANAYLQYSQLLSLHPDDPNYNYRFGACMLFSQADKKKPIDYIENAIKQSTVDNLAYFYLGRAYHLNYRFDDAIKAYQHFKSNASGSDLKKHPVDHLIEMCTNGKQLLGNLHDLDVLRKKELDIADYYQAYDLSSNGGTLLTEPDDFKTKTDKKKGLNSIIYLSPDRSKLFFASYGDDDKNGKDIYVAYKLPNGAWGKPSNLGSVINTQYDEDYPFYDEPTHTLYFSSMGHNSMGGYDIFKSVYNEANNTWSQPVNMDFPINTPGDDILFLADTMNQTAFFSSTRSSPNGKIAVYKITIEPHAPDYVVVKGITYNDGGSTIATSRITVKDYLTNEVIGVFNSSTDNGSYVMNLANGGHFLYTVEMANHKTQSESVTLPAQNGLTPLQQFITYEPSTDRLIIKNTSQGTVSDSNYLLALDMIQKKAEMDVNVDTTAPRKVRPVIQQPVATNNPQPTNPVKVQPPDTGLGENDTNSDIAIVDTTGKHSVSTNQLLEIASNDAKQLQNDAKSEKDDANKAIEYAVNKMTESQQLEKAAQEAVTNADKITDPKQKQDTLDKAAQLKQQSQDAAKKSMEGFEYASQLQIQASVKQKEADHATQYTTKLDSALKSHDKQNAIKKLQAQRDSLQKQDVLNAPTTPTAADLIRIQSQNTRQDSVEAVKHNEDLQKEADRLQQESDDYVNQAQKTDNASEKVALLAQARDLGNSKKEKENEIQENQKTLVDLHNKYNDLQTQAKQVDSITKNNPTALQISSTDAATIKTDIKASQPAVVQTNPGVNNSTQTNPNPINPTQTNLAQTNPNPTVVDTSHHVQPSNPVAVNNPTQTNPTQANPNPTNPNPSVVDTSHHTQPSNPVVVNNPTQTNPIQTNPNPTNPNPTIVDTSHHSQPSNPVAVNNPTQTNPIQTNPAVTNPNPVQTNPTEPGIDTVDHAQPGNPVSVNPTHPNPVQANPTEPGIDTVDHTQPSNPIATNPTRTNPVQTNPNPTGVDTSHHAQPSNPVVVNNPTQTNPTQTNPNPTLVDTSHHAQPSNPVAINNPTQTNPTQINPTQTNPNPTVVDTSHHAQPSIQVAINNPTQTNPTQINPTQTNPNLTVVDTSHHAQPGNPVAVNNPTQTNPTQPNPSTANPNPTVVDTTHNGQPGNPVVVNPTQTNPSVTNPNPANPIVAEAKYTDPAAATADKSYIQLNSEVQHLSSEATGDRDKARLATDPEEARKLLHSADSLDDEAGVEKIAATMNKTDADRTQYQTNRKTLTAWQTVMKSSTDNSVTLAQLKAVDAARYYDLAIKERQKADSTTSAGDKQVHLDQAKEYLETAMQKQQESHDLLLQANPNLKNVTPENAQTVAVQPANPIQTNPNPVNPVQTNPNPTVPDTTHSVQPGNPVAINNPTQTNPNPANPTQANPIQTNPTVSAGTHTQPVNPAINNPGQQPTTNPVADGTPTARINEIKELPRSPYSRRHPIPINAPLPEGLIYKVQIGAFGKPIQQNAFKGLEPIAGETTATGLTRYTAGIFKEFNKAKDALGQVKNIGYKDAFIVAFYNGKRIPITQAAAIQSSTQPSPTATQPIALTNPANPSVPDTGTHQQTSAPVVSTPVTDVKGIFYTVQVGAFKTTVTSDKLFNLSPLFSYNASNGYIRYNCGIYSTVPKASTAKDAIVARTPIKDAFVVAYYNGERIPITKATQMISDGTAVISQNPKLDIVPAGTNSTGGGTNTPPAVNNPQPVAPVNNTPAPHTNSADTGTKVTFCVQVGAFSGDIPVTEANNLLKIASQGIATHKGDDGITVYTVGSYPYSGSATMLKEELIQDGFPGCFVVAYYKGKKISLQEAQSIINK